VICVIPIELFGVTMPLISKLFREDQKLSACLVHDSAHILLGSQGEHVAKLQTAVSRLDGYTIAFSEIRDKYYGETTAKAVLAYKRKRKIVNFAYQSQADNIVGKMTIASLDKEFAALEVGETLIGPGQNFRNASVRR
jgi:peptidoglycan hydrolase-like protein with peptidoglycan-binding domain